MGRSVVHLRNSYGVRWALWCAALTLPILLCACRRARNLVDDVADTAYRIRPAQIHFDDELTDADEQRISAINLAYVPEPTRLRDRKPVVYWDMTLQDVIYHSLTNTKILRLGGQFQSPNNSLLRSPEGVATTLDRAIQSTGVLFGQRGEQAALSEFDAQFTTRMLWGNSSAIQNNRNSGITPGGALTEDTAQFQSSLQKSLYSGGQIGLSHNWNYSANNIPRLFPSAYDGFLKAEFRQPLLAGSGSDYTRIAGPISDNIQGVTGVQQGILIARLNNKIAVAEFETSVVGYLRDVEQQYWQLYIAYETQKVQQDSLDDAKRILQLVEAREDAPGGELLRKVEAREGVLQAEQQLLKSIDAVYTNESQLRTWMGFHTQNDRMIHPIDQPVKAEVKHDWSSSMGSALARRSELIRQKVAINSAELQLRAAENLNRPRFDFLASGQTNGFGDRLLGRRIDGATKLGNAYSRLLSGNETAWSLGVEYSQPIGLRFAGQQVKNNELKLARANAILEAQEAEVLNQLTAAFQAVDRTYLVMQTHVSLVKNAEDRMDAVEADYNTNKDGRAYLDLDSLNRARETYSRAAVELRQAEVEYSMALTDIEKNCGRLLEFHNVHLDSNPHAAMNISGGTAPETEQHPQVTPPMLPPAGPAPDAPPPVKETPLDKDTLTDSSEEGATEFVSTEDVEVAVESPAAAAQEADAPAAEWARTPLARDEHVTGSPAEAVPLVEEWARAETSLEETAETTTKTEADATLPPDASPETAPAAEIEQP